MNIVHVAGDAYRISDGTDVVELSPTAYEDVFCALPIDSGTLYLLLTDSLSEAADRAALKRMLERAGGMEGGMALLQERIRAVPPTAAPAPPESATPSEPEPDWTPVAVPALPPPPLAPLAHIAPPVSPARPPVAKEPERASPAANVTKRPTTTVIPTAPATSQASPTAPVTKRPSTIIPAAQPTSPAAADVGPSPVAPAARTSARPTARFPAPAVLVPGSPPDKSVMSVTDDSRTTHAIEEALRGSRFGVGSSIPDIEKALKAYETQRTTLVLLDLHVPGALEQTLGGGLNPIRQFLQLDGNCRIVVTYTEEIKPLLAGAIRAGASGHVQVPFRGSDLLEALNKALTARTVTAAPAALGVRRALACAWKPVDAGLLTAAKSFIAHELDLVGLEGRLDDKIREGASVRLTVELPGAKKPLQIAGIVSTSKYDHALRKSTVRFKFTERTQETLDRLRGFLAEAQAKAMK